MRSLIALIAILAISATPALAQQPEFTADTDDKVYVTGQPLLVYGNANPGEGVIVRLFAPDGTIARFNQADPNEDGSFSHVLLTWPTPTSDMPYGTYTVEAIASGDSTLIDVTFAADTLLTESPATRQISTSVLAPESASIHATMRVFVQTTSDGLLVAGDPTTILRASHVHLPDGSAVALATQFRTLHQGLYYVDYEPASLGTHVFHTVVFHQGTASHGSAVTNVLGSDIGRISEQIVELDRVLAQTSDELDRLRGEIGGFGSTLGAASARIDESVGSMRSSVTSIEGASLQLNSLFFPIVGLVAFIVALQLVILSRWR